MVVIGGVGTRIREGEASKLDWEGSHCRDVVVFDGVTEKVGEELIGDGCLDWKEISGDVGDNTLDISPFMLEGLGESGVGCLGINSGHL